MTNETKATFTPGPWDSREFGSYGPDGPSCFLIYPATTRAMHDQAIARTEGYSALDSANAHLIAAAPTMATAGKVLAQWLYTTRNPGELPVDIKEAMAVFEAMQ